MAQCLRALGCSPKLLMDLSLIPKHPHQAATTNCLQLQFQKIQCHLLASTGTHMWHIHTDTWINKVNGDTDFRKKYLKFPLSEWLACFLGFFVLFFTYRCVLLARMPAASTDQNKTQDVWELETLSQLPPHLEK